MVFQILVKTFFLSTYSHHFFLLRCCAALMKSLPYKLLMSCVWQDLVMFSMTPFKAQYPKFWNLTAQGRVFSTLVWPGWCDYRISNFVKVSPVQWQQQCSRERKPIWTRSFSPYLFFCFSKDFEAFLLKIYFGLPGLTKTTVPEHTASGSLRLSGEILYLVVH